MSAAGGEELARLCEHCQRLLDDHRRLLADPIRNRAFYRALKKVIRPKDRVLDIGSGTGVWAVAAATLGAERVVAVERDPLLLGVARELADENGVAARVEVVAGDSRRLALEREFDVVVTETVGNLAFDEEIAPIAIDARQRFLKPGGRIVPQAVELVAAPARERAPRSVPAGVPLRGASFVALALHASSAVSVRKRLSLLGPRAVLARADLTTADAPPDLSDLVARWALEEGSRADCFAVWPEATLAPGVRLSGWRANAWTPEVYRFLPFTRSRGELELRLSLSGPASWTVTLAGEGGRETRSYSPTKSASALLAAERCAGLLPSRLLRDHG